MESAFKVGGYFIFFTLMPVLISYFYCRKGYKKAENKAEYLSYLDFVSYLLGGISLAVFSYVYFFKEKDVLLPDAYEILGSVFENAKFYIFIAIGTGLGMGLFRRRRIWQNSKNN